MKTTNVTELVYHKGVLDTDPDFTKYLYQWERYDKDGNKDENFEVTNVEVNGIPQLNTIVIKEEDVWQKATFNCIIYKK